MSYTPTHGLPSLLPKRELLTSQYDGTLHHASYASALTTLCGLPVKVEQRGMDAPPDCAACETTARAFHRIDASMPEHWTAYTVAPVEKDAA